MPTSKDKVIEELVSVVLMQEREINKLRRSVRRLKRYIEVYEEYIRGEGERWPL